MQIQTYFCLLCHIYKAQVFSLYFCICFILEDASTIRTAGQYFCCCLQWNEKPRQTVILDACKYIFWLHSPAVLLDILCTTKDDGLSCLMHSMAICTIIMINQIVLNYMMYWIVHDRMLYIPPLFSLLETLLLSNIIQSANQCWRKPRLDERDQGMMGSLTQGEREATGTQVTTLYKLHNRKNISECTSCTNSPTLEMAWLIILIVILYTE